MGSVLFGNSLDDSLVHVRGVEDGANDAGRLEFLTEGTGGGADIRMTIKSDGNVGIGMTDPNGIFQTSGGIAGDITVGGSAAGSASLFVYQGVGHTGEILNLNNKVLVDNDGNVGIGTKDPSRQVEIEGNAFASYLALTRNDASTGNLMGSVLFGNSLDDSLVHVRGVEDGANDAGRLEFLTEGTGGGADIRMTIKSDGNVGIGTTSPQSKLAVNGTIDAKEVKVTNTGWADFVFEDDYELPSLSNVESYIKKNKHLPDIPSAQEVEQNGLAVSDMLAKQMQKIEELTLYLIQLKKENDQLKKRVSVLEGSKRRTTE